MQTTQTISEITSDFLTQCLFDLKKQNLPRLNSYQLILWSEKGHDLFANKLSSKEKENLQEKYDKFRTKLEKRAKNIAEQWMDQHPDIASLIEQSKVGPDTDLFGELEDIHHSLRFAHFSNETYQGVVKTIGELYGKIVISCPHSYACDEISQEDKMLLKHFSPLSSESNSACIEKIWAAFCAALRHFILSCMNHPLSTHISHAAGSQYHIAQDHHSAKDWDCFLNEIGALYEHFHPEQTDKIERVFPQDMLYAYRFVTAPQMKVTPNSDLEVAFMYGHYMGKQRGEYDDSGVARARFRKHLMQHLPEIRSSIIELRKALADEYEGVSITRLFCSPDEEKIRAAVENFATAFFKLRDSDERYKELYPVLSAQKLHPSFN